MIKNILINKKKLFALLTAGTISISTLASCATTDELNNEDSIASTVSTTVDVDSMQEVGINLQDNSILNDSNTLKAMNPSITEKFTVTTTPSTTTTIKTTTSNKTTTTKKETTAIAQNSDNQNNDNQNYNTEYVTETQYIPETEYIPETTTTTTTAQQPVVNDEYRAFITKYFVDAKQSSLDMKVEYNSVDDACDTVAIYYIFIQCNFAMYSTEGFIPIRYSDLYDSQQQQLLDAAVEAEEYLMSEYSDYVSVLPKYVRMYEGCQDYNFESLKSMQKTR